MIAAIVALFYVAGIVMAVEAVMTARTPQGSIAWAVSLVTVPFVAVPAYLVLGRSKFEGMTAAYQQRQAEVDALIAEGRRGLQPWLLPDADRPAWAAGLQRLSGMALTKGNSAQLLINGDATFDSIIAGIAAAKDYVLVQFYMFHDDGLGKRMQQALIERAKAGLRVQVLYDEVGSKGLPDSYTRALADAGVKVSSFKPTQGWRNRFQINFRNHRKMVVVDGVTGWVGGHNVGDEYLGLEAGFTPWRDTHVRLEGPVVMQLQAVIVHDWFWATHELPKLNWEPRAAAKGAIAAQIVASAPAQRLETAGMMFTAALDAARERIWLSAPYFVPDEPVVRALALAALRGVDVRVITTGKGDSMAVFLAAFAYIDRLRDLGITFYAYKPGFLHEKVALVDRDVSTVGTANFDNRSFRLNFEVTAIILDRDFGKEMEAMFERDFAHAEKIDPAGLDKKSFWWHLGVQLSRLASPVL